MGKLLLEIFEHFKNVPCRLLGIAEYSMLGNITLLKLFDDSVDERRMKIREDERKLLTLATDSRWKRACVVEEVAKKPTDTDDQRFPPF